MISDSLGNVTDYKACCKSRGGSVGRNISAGKANLYLDKSQDQ